MKYLSIIIILTFISCHTTQNVTKKQVTNNLPKRVYYKNIKISEGDALITSNCEPSIVVNPTNTDNIIAGNVLDDYHYSFDGGLTWNSKKMQSNLGVYGDPCLIADNKGNVYYLHLSNPDNWAYGSKHFLNQIVIHRSEDGGKTWNDGNGIGKNEPKQQDKEWIAVNPMSNELYVTWTEFDKYGSMEPQNKSRIRFASSNDFGQTFSKAITISELEGDAIDDDNTAEGAVPAVDLEGNIYVSWALQNKIYFDKSEDNGKTWLKNDKIIAIQKAGWTHDIPGINRCNGMPVTAVDVSSSPYSGTIYINWTDQLKGKNDTDVYLIKSSDKGETWSAPIRVNQDKTNTHQFLTWMSVDAVTGYIYIVYYDRSHYKNQKTDVVLAVSKDGGITFTNEVISEKPFIPDTSVFFGDYNNISAYNGVVRPIWTRYEEGKLSVWTAIINVK